LADDPCEPNPCGPHSNPPRNVGGRCDCSCLPGVQGSPPNCRPECVINDDCPTDKACQNQRCQDPCPGTCGINANCRVRNHLPICACNKNYVGDPFSNCNEITSKCDNLPFIILNQCCGSMIFWCGSGSMPLTNGSGCGSGSCYFHH
jgi:hypothetical protein